VSTKKDASLLLSVVILTRDEEENLPYCLESLSNLPCETFVVDSGSHDATLDIARQAGCQVFKREFVNHAEQLNWALDELPIRTPWVMRLDADEWLTRELVQELNENLPTLPSQVSALMVKRRVYFWGRWIRHGGYYPTWLTRVWRHGYAHCEARWMDEHMVVREGTVHKMSHDLVDENRKDLTFWTEKHNHYADGEVKDILDTSASELEGLVGQARTRRWLKSNVYSHAPLFLRAFFYWIYRYVFLLGFLDGTAGLIFHFLQGFWYRFLVDAKLYEHRLSSNQK
jgi:glycosyltransferase involved in cell wall biosynthesis